MQERISFFDLRERVFLFYFRLRLRFSPEVGEKHAGQLNHMFYCSPDTQFGQVSKSG